MLRDRRAWAAAAGLAAFLALAPLALQLFPSPRQPTDYLVAGSVATLGALAVLFAMLFKRRDS